MTTATMPTLFAKEIKLLEEIISLALNKVKRDIVQPLKQGVSIKDLNDKLSKSIIWGNTTLLEVTAEISRIMDVVTRIATNSWRHHKFRPKIEKPKKIPTLAEELSTWDEADRSILIHHIKSRMHMLEVKLKPADIAFIEEESKKPEHQYPDPTEPGHCRYGCYLCFNP